MDERVDVDGRTDGRNGARTERDMRIKYDLMSKSAVPGYRPLWLKATVCGYNLCNAL